MESLEVTVFVNARIAFFLCARICQQLLLCVARVNTSATMTPAPSVCVDWEKSITENKDVEGGTRNVLEWDTGALHVGIVEQLA